MSDTIERTVLFADLSGSTGLFENLGNTQATTLVTRCVQAVAQAVLDHDGRVVKTMGDGLFAVFRLPLEAILAADEMHRSVLHVGQRAQVRVRLQVAVEHGEVVAVGDDYFGDAINVAARLLQHADESETLATEHVRTRLPLREQTRFRALSKMHLRGRQEPVLVYSLATRSDNEPSTTYAELPDAPVSERLRLSQLDASSDYSIDQSPITLGRGSEASFLVNDSRVSRLHARIEWRNGTFVLSDASSNGTFVRFSHGADVIALRRAECTLHGSGSIALGASFEDLTTPTVRFEILAGASPAGRP